MALPLVRHGLDDRSTAIGRARTLNRLTIAWNAVEGAVAITAGIVAGSVSLVGFGFDSGIEVSAALVLSWRLRRERLGGSRAADDRTATRLVALSFAALAVYVVIDAGADLLTSTEPETSVPGMILAALSLVVMPTLARAKARLAPVLGSQAQAAEARQTLLCAWLSAVLLMGLALNAVVGWWWADPIAALFIGLAAGHQARQTWRAESLEDTCCA